MREAAALPMAPARIGPQVALVAGFLACAGLPLYIHLPRFASEIGLPLSTIGLLLLGLRLMDFAQDPLLGWLVERHGDRRATWAAVAILMLGAAFAAVFTLGPGLPGLIVALVAVFTAYSLGTILFYSQGVALAGDSGDAAHFRLAGWREAGTVAGIVSAAALPILAGYAALGLAVAVAAPLIWLLSRDVWQAPVRPSRAAPSFRALIRGSALRLMILALLNALPVAMTSTLFLFFVEDRLGLGPYAGGYLVLFFLSAGLSAPLWSQLAARFGARPVLLPAMILAVVAFAWTALLPSGAALGFGVICGLSGIALGADMVILPALFAATLARAHLPAALGFGAWAFAAKLALALAAGLTLPLLDWSGYTPGAANDDAALSTLNIAYAVVPLFLKLLAIWMVARLSDEVPT